MRRKILVLTFMVLVVCAWSPWITEETASRLAVTQFNKAWNGVMDGCGAYGNDLGPHNFQKIPFGAMVTLDYQCGLVMPDDPPHHATVYVSFFGVTLGYPKPSF